jgi:hypothetical protein
MGVAIGVAVGFILLYVAASAAYDEPSKTALAENLFPYAVVLDPSLLKMPWSLLALSLVQYPLYGGAFGFAWRQNRGRLLVLLLSVAFIVGLHVTFAKSAHIARFQYVDRSKVVPEFSARNRTNRWTRGAGACFAS